MYQGRATQGVPTIRPPQPRLQPPAKQHKRFSWQNPSVESLPQQANGNQHGGHRVNKSVDSQWSYEETPVEHKHPRDPIQRLAREPDMSTIAQSPVTPIDGRPQSFFAAQPQPAAKVYGENEYPPEKSASAFHQPTAPRASVHQVQSEFPPEKFPNEKNATPYDITPPSQPHPATYAPVVSRIPQPQPQPVPQQISQQQITQQYAQQPTSPGYLPHHQPISPLYAPNVPTSPGYPPQQRQSQLVQQPPRQSMAPRQSIPFIPTPIQIPSYTRDRTTPSQTPTSARAPRTPRSPEPFPPQSPNFYQDSRTPISPPTSPGPLPTKNPDEFALPSPTFIRQRPISSHTDIASPKSPTTPAPPVFLPDAPMGPNGLQLDLHQPGQIKHPNMENADGKDGEWKHGLFGCGGDVGTCVTGLFCPCVLYGRTAYRLSQKSAKKDPTVLLGHSAVNGQCGVMGFASLCGLGCLFPMVHRTRLRHMYKLTGSLFGDIAKACCCCCCVAIQNEREVRDREESSRRWAGPASEAYAAPGQMVYAPPPRG